jgi:ABC-type spermidine/putrescine transport system permease subunit I
VSQAVGLLQQDGQRGINAALLIDSVFLNVAGRTIWTASSVSAIILLLADPLAFTIVWTFSSIHCPGESTR